MLQEELGPIAYLQVPTTLQSQIFNVSFLGPSFGMRAGPYIASLRGDVGIYRSSQCSQSWAAQGNAHLIRDGEEEWFQSSAPEAVLSGLGWTHFNHVNNPWLSALSIKQLTEPVASGGYGIFPLFKLWVRALFSDSLIYIQKNSVCLGPFPNHRPPLDSCPLYCVLCGICRGGWGKKD